MAAAVAATALASVAADAPGPAHAAGTPGANSATAFGTATVTAKAPPGAKPVVGMAATTSGHGVWLAAADGGIFSYGDASFHGSLGGLRLNKPIVAMTAPPMGGGYWMAATDGGVFAFGRSRFHGSLGSIALNRPIVGMASTPTGNGYWLVASDGGVFSFGDAGFHGSLGSMALNQPVVGMAATATGDGYWLVAADGGIFAFGQAPFHGSLGSLKLNQPVVGMAARPAADGYWLGAADGGIFAFGNAPFKGSDGAARVPHPAVGMAARADGNGYWIAYGRTALGPQVSAYVATRHSRVTAAVLDLVTGETSTFRPEVVTHTASTLKVDILATLLRRAQAEGRGLTDRERSLAKPMIQESNDPAANAFWVQLGAGEIGRFQRDAGMSAQTVPNPNGKWGATTTTALDRLVMLRHLVFPSPLLTDASRAYVLDLMRGVVPSQRWGITGGVPSDVAAGVPLKNGFATIDGWQINSYGWVQGHGRNYLLAVLTDRNATMEYGIETANGVSAIVWSVLAP